MKILFLATEDFAFWSHRLAIARAARDAGHQVVVVAHENHLRAAFEREGIELVPWRVSRSSINPLTEALSLLDVYKAYRRIKPDVAHHLALKPAAYGSIVARLLRIPSVNAVTGLGVIFHGVTWKRRIVWKVLSTMLRFGLGSPQSVALFQIEADRNALVRERVTRGGSSFIIPGAGADIKRFAHRPERAGEPVVLTACRLTWSKGLAELIEASRKLQAEGVRVRFALAGRLEREDCEGVPEATLQRWIEEGIVEYWGNRSDMHEALAACHIFCLPSHHEGVPKVLLEACAAGRPIVASDIPGCRAVVKHGVNGLLAPVRNAAALAAAIRTLALTPSIRDYMGRRGRKLAEENFSEEMVVRDTFKLYELVSGMPIRPAVISGECFVDEASSPANGWEHSSGAIGPGAVEQHAMKQ